ncbi:hypothetical protein M422DRAFT_35508 [Sphaerobolus stellatus SS14]|uniref:non-specific serine/threonine protein kinase n=1 Tax=Sphaerobolus stellatus (strain SS14) TaxID=990650 RepID=A0A0C9V7M3_SPHS4|nr:hypothetical protein M422DRAFT_35508 [Sphaerobolus stellatus SS14]
MIDLHFERAHPPHTSTHFRVQNNTPMGTLDTETLTFPEEPVGIPASEGFGYLEVDIGDTIGPEMRYRIVRKLGFGRSSTVWMAYDNGSTQESTARKYVVIKILTAFATRMSEQGSMLEKTISAQLANPLHLRGEPRVPARPSRRRVYCLFPYGSFVQTNPVTSENHLCFLLNPAGPNLNAIRHRFPEAKIPLPLVKRIVTDTVAALYYLHRTADVVHTDLKADNILLESTLTDAEIADIIRSDPPQHYPVMKVLGRDIKPVISQSLSFPIDKGKFMLADYSHAQMPAFNILTPRITNYISPEPLRAPETVLGINWGEGVDIWALGCLIFQLITGKQLFRPTEDPSKRWSKDEDHLLQMLQITGQRFSDSSIMSVKLKRYLALTGPDDFYPHFLFDSFFPDYRHISMIDRLRQEVNIIPGSESDQELQKATDFIEGCLHLDKDQRYGVVRLLYHDWIRKK